MEANNIVFIFFLLCFLIVIINKALCEYYGVLTPMEVEAPRVTWKRRD